MADTSIASIAYKKKVQEVLLDKNGMENILYQYFIYFISAETKFTEHTLGSCMEFSIHMWGGGGGGGVSNLKHSF